MAGRRRALPEAAQSLVSYIFDAGGALVAGTGEHLVHALTRDGERTGKLGLAGARLVRGEQGAAEVAPSPVETLERVECLQVSTYHGPDFSVVRHACTISGKVTLHLRSQE
jgi:hypothetical protein